MTQEERQQLINSLYTASDDTWSDYAGLCKEAAEEIEQLADRVNSLETVAALNLQQGEKLAAENDRLAALAQSDAEPVAWRYRVKGSSSWFVALKDDYDAAYWRASNYEVEPLYTARVMDNGEIR